MNKFMLRTAGVAMAMALATSAYAAGGKGTTYSSNLLALVLNGTAMANFADNAASSPATTLCLSLHTADPGAGGSAATNEAAYTSYARVSIARTAGGWTVSGATATLTSTQSFPAATGGSETETFFGLSVPPCSGTAKILYRGPISPTLAVSSGVTPQLTTGSTITEQ